MKEKIERLSKGIFEYELPSICLSEEEVKITVEAGKVWEGSLTVSNSVGRRMKGILYSSNRLLTFGSSSFFGTENGITYQFDATYLSEGENIQGEICIVSDCGEQLITFTAQIEAPCYLSALGKIKDLFQFTNLARMDWTDAKKAFRCEDFERIFLRNEEKYKLIYRNLRKSISTSQALEEFLIAIHKKSAIHLSIDRTSVEYLVSNEEFMDKIILTKDHWGYAEIKVSTDAAFIQLEQKFVWADHFIGNTQQISFTINSENMKRGNNFGKIYIKTVHQTLTMEVVCRFRKESEYTPSIERQRQKVEFSLIENYLNFRLNRINLTRYLEDSEVLLEQMPEGENNRAGDLIRTHLAIISGKNLLAEQMLESFEKEENVLKKNSVVDYCTYLYLKALYHKEEETIKNATETIRRYYENGYFDWRLLWFLLYTDKRYDKNKNTKLADIKEQFENGCHSPILYYEAVCIFNEEPFQLRDLGDFEIQILNYGIRNWLLSKDAMQQYTYLANKKKTFHPIIFHGLVKLYDEYETAEILSSICCMLIKGLKKSVKYFEWYRLGVEAQLRITELYEYYIYSIDETTKEPLAAPVLLYFIYNSNLNDKKKAYLYSNIIYNKGKNESIYRTYYKRMEVFAAKQLMAHHISPNLSDLYCEFLNINIPGGEISNHLPYVLFRNELICENPNMIGVTVIHRELEVEENRPLAEGRALIDIYTVNAEIFFIDSFGNRYVASVDYKLNPLMPSEVYENHCVEYSNHPMLMLHLFNRYQNNRIINEKAIFLRKQVLKIEGLKERYRNNCLRELAEYYFENNDEEQLEYYLMQIDLSTVTQEERINLVEYMVIWAFYDKALDALKLFGYEKIAVNRLLKLCSQWIASQSYPIENEFLLDLCHYVFRKGKYDETILQYLVKFYQGPTGEMYGLWKAAKGFDLEPFVLEERLITQMLFAESYVQDSFSIFNEYYKQVTNHLLVKAFLTFYAYKYLVHDRVINTELFPVMKRELNYEENDICLLAWMKYCTSRQELPLSELDFIEYSIHRLEKKNIVLSFFTMFHKVIKMPDRLTDKCFVEYKTDPQKQVYIHYRLLKGNSSQDYITERLPNIFMGIHGKEFILFYHEILQYYITEEFGEDITITESFHLHFDQESAEDEESKYNQINLMLMAMEMQDEKTLLEIMEHFVKTEHMISKCFQPISNLE